MLFCTSYRIGFENATLPGALKSNTETFGFIICGKKKFKNYWRFKDAHNFTGLKNSGHFHSLTQPILSTRIIEKRTSFSRFSLNAIDLTSSKIFCRKTSLTFGNRDTFLIFPKHISSPTSLQLDKVYNREDWDSRSRFFWFSDDEEKSEILKNHRFASKLGYYMRFERCSK